MGILSVRLSHPHRIHVIVMLYSEIMSRTVFFVIIYNRFVDSSRCGPHDFDPTVIGATLYVTVVTGDSHHRWRSQEFATRGV